MPEHVDEVLPEDQEEEEAKEEVGPLMTIVMSGGLAALLSIILCYSFFKTIGQAIIKEAVYEQMYKAEQKERSMLEDAKKRAALEGTKRAYQNAVLDDEF